MTSHHSRGIACRFCPEEERFSFSDRRSIPGKGMAVGGGVGGKHLRNPLGCGLGIWAKPAQRFLLKVGWGDQGNKRSF